MTSGHARNRSRRAGGALALALALAATGCVSPSDPLSHMDSLEYAQKRYTEAIRWGDLERAARYVDPEMRDDFLALSEAFEDIRITDYEIGEVEMADEEKLHAEVSVTYKGYALPYYVENSTRDLQVWQRVESLGDHRWQVKPELEPLIVGLGGRR